MTSTVTEAPTEHFVQLKKFNVHYWEAGTGHPLFLLHGGGPGATGMTNYSPNIGPLSQKFRVIAPDMPGWGESDSQTTETGFDHPGVLLELMDALGIDKAALVGNSMGGMTSITVSANHPERVSHLITMGAPAPLPSFLGPAGPSEGIKALANAYLDMNTATMRKLLDVMVHDSSFATDELCEARAAAALSHPEHLKNWGQWVSDPKHPVPPYFSLGFKVREITAPTLVVQGRDDRAVPYESALQLLTLITNSRLHMFNRCGHWAQIEYADEFNRLVEDFITHH